jgi:hypothetical protein
MVRSGNRREPEAKEKQIKLLLNKVTNRVQFDPMSKNDLFF